MYRLFKSSFTYGRLHMPINTQSFGNTQAHSDTDQRDTGSVTHRQDQKIELRDVQKYLEGLQFPANKYQVVDYAKQKNAPSNVVDLLEQMPTSEFGSPNDSNATEYKSIEDLIREIERVE
jgi:hypothetical protein